MTKYNFKKCNILSIGTPPFFHLELFYQNVSGWPKMDFKHTLKTVKFFLTRPPPTIVKNFTLPLQFQIKI